MEADEQIYLVAPREGSSNYVAMSMWEEDEARQAGWHVIEYVRRDLIEENEPDGQA